MKLENESVNAMKAVQMVTDTFVIFSNLWKMHI